MPVETDRLEALDRLRDERGVVSDAPEGSEGERLDVGSGLEERPRCRFDRIRPAERDECVETSRHAVEVSRSATSTSRRAVTPPR